jgi:hypothetical protein
MGGAVGMLGKGAPSPPGRAAHGSLRRTRAGGLTVMIAVPDPYGSRFRVYGLVT